MPTEEFKQYRLTPDVRFYRKLEIQDASGTWQDVTDYWIDYNRLSIDHDLEDPSSLIPREKEFYFTLHGDWRTTFVIGDNVRLTVYFTSDDTYVIFQGEIVYLTFTGIRTRFRARTKWLDDLKLRNYLVGAVDSKGYLLPVWSFRHLRDYLGVDTLSNWWKKVRDYFLNAENSATRLEALEKLADFRAMDVVRTTGTDEGIVLAYIKEGKLYCENWTSPIGPKAQASTTISSDYFGCKILYCNTTFDYDPDYKVQVLVWGSHGDASQFTIYFWDMSSSSLVAGPSDATWSAYTIIGTSLAYQEYDSANTVRRWWAVGQSGGGDLYICDLWEDGTINAIYMIAASGDYVLDEYAGCSVLGLNSYYFGEYYGYTTEPEPRAFVYHGATNSYSEVNVASYGDAQTLRTYYYDTTNDIYFACSRRGWWLSSDGELQYNSNLNRASYGWEYRNTSSIDCVTADDETIYVHSVSPTFDTAGAFTGININLTTSYKIHDSGWIRSPSSYAPYYTGLVYFGVSGVYHHVVLLESTQYEAYPYHYGGWLFFTDGKRRYFAPAVGLEDPYTSDLEAFKELSKSILIALTSKTTYGPYYVKTADAAVDISEDLINKDTLRIYHKPLYDSLEAGSIRYPDLGKNPLDISCNFYSGSKLRHYLRFLWRAIFKTLTHTLEFEGPILIESDLLKRITITSDKFVFSYTPEIYVDSISYHLPRTLIRAKIADLDIRTRLYYPFEEGQLPAPFPVTATTASGGSLTADTYYYYKVQAFDGVVWSPLSQEVYCRTTTSDQTIEVSWESESGAYLYRVWRGTSSGGQNEYYDTTETSITDDGSLSWTSGTPSENDLLYVFDYSRYFNHGSCTDIKSITGKYGVLLNGSSSYIDAGYKGTGLTDELTVLVACKMTKQDATQVLVHRGEHGTSGYHIYNYYDSVAGTNNFIFRVIGASGSVSCSTEATFDELVTLALTYKSGEGGAGYVNGSSIGTIGDSGDIDYTNDSHVGIGANIYSTPQYFFGGEIYEVKIIGRKYSQSEIQKWHNEVKRKFS